MKSLQNKQALFSLVFWLVLVTFIAWDFAKSTDINQRDEPPLIAAGSGKAPTGAHCSLPK
ncbi:MAG: hypothetical protein RL761_1716 [Pseudomonadota bacterium]|jgi:hypothetical protein